MSSTARRSVVLVVLALLTLSAATLVRGQVEAKPAKPAAAKPAPIVTITKTDGSLVRGRLTSSDPEQVTLQLVAAGKPAAEGETVNVSWRDVTRVSNGLTRAEAVEAFKAAHAGQLCGTCHGSAMIACATCKGTAHDPAAGKDCKTCGGELLVDCEASATLARRAAAQAVPEEGRGRVDDAERRERCSAPRRGSTSMYFSERHIGELIYVKNGEVVGEGKCTACGGTSIAVCATCGGNRKTPAEPASTRKDALPHAPRPATRATPLYRLRGQGLEEGLSTCRRSRPTGRGAGVPPASRTEKGRPNAPRTRSRLPPCKTRSEVRRGCQRRGVRRCSTIERVVRSPEAARPLRPWALSFGGPYLGTTKPRAGDPESAGTVGASCHGVRGAPTEWAAAPQRSFRPGTDQRNTALSFTTDFIAEAAQILAQIDATAIDRIVERLAQVRGRGATVLPRRRRIGGELLARGQRLPQDRRLRGLRPDRQRERTHRPHERRGVETVFVHTAATAAG